MGATSGDVNQSPSSVRYESYLSDLPTAGRLSGDRAYVAEPAVPGQNLYFLDKESTLSTSLPGVVATNQALATSPTGKGRWLSENLYGAGASSPDPSPTLYSHSVSGSNAITGIVPPTSIALAPFTPNYSGAARIDYVITGACSPNPSTKSCVEFTVQVDDGINPPITVAKSGCTSPAPNNPATAASVAFFNVVAGTTYNLSLLGSLLNGSDQFDINVANNGYAQAAFVITPYVVTP